MAITSSVRATSLSFAQFSEANAGGNLFAYLDKGPSGDAEFGTFDGTTLGAPIPVNFNFLNLGVLPSDLSNSQAATLTMTSSTISPVNNLANIVGVQPITGAGTVVDKITITRNTPALEGNNGKTNLLTVTFTGQLIGAFGGRTPQLSSDTDLNFNVQYTSDFLSFNNAAEKDFSLGFSSWTNSGNGNGLSLSALLSDVYFAAAATSAAGTFDGTATFVPEPATWLLGIICAGMLVLTARHLTRQQKTLAECRVKA